MKSKKNTEQAFIGKPLSIRERNILQGQYDPKNQYAMRAMFVVGRWLADYEATVKDLEAQLVNSITFENHEACCAEHARQVDQQHKDFIDNIAFRISDIVRHEMESYKISPRIKSLLGILELHYKERGTTLDQVVHDLWWNQIKSMANSKK